MVDFLREDQVTVDPAAWQKGVVKLGERGVAMLDAAIDRLAGSVWDRDSIEAALRSAGHDAGFLNAEGQVQMSKAQAPVRVAVTGRTVGPPLYESLVVLERGRTLDRLRKARARL